MPEPQQKSPSFFNNNKLSTVVNSKGTIISLTPIFVLCDRCHWCSTYLDKTRMSIEKGKCPNCYNINTLSSFPVMSNESFTFGYDEKRGVELKFMHRK
jgi:hypothetical protein